MNYPKRRQRLAVDFAKEIVERHKVAADVAIHQPSEAVTTQNHHAHILITTRQLTEDGFTRKPANWTTVKAARLIVEGTLCRATKRTAKETASAETVDHRTLKAQGIDREPTNI